ncbi:hypothetical protein V491_05995, partial [Pseudogymnoascus sp. VKM F-3775]
MGGIIHVGARCRAEAGNQGWRGGVEGEARGGGDEWMDGGIGAFYVSALNIIHVAGTKGKGSTCAYTESLLLAHGTATGWPKSVGMYTSPHLLVPQERVRLNGTAIDERGFARYFFEVWERLFAAEKVAEE